MTSRELSTFIRTYTDEIWNQHNPAAMPRFYADTYLHHDTSRPDVRNLANYQQWARDLLAAFPNLTVQIDDLITDPDQSKAVKRWTAHGLHTGPLGEIPATNKNIKFSGVSSYRIQSGKIIESWYLYDLFGLLTQLGALAK
jgi:steroid delta-isomerase-like uncharacterized protein